MLVVLSFSVVATTIKGTVTPELDYLVMKAYSKYFSKETKIHYILLGFRQTKRGMEAWIGWHILRKSPKTLTFAFQSFSILSGGLEYKSTGVPDPFPVEFDEAGSFPVLFPESVPITRLGVFTLSENVPAGVTGIVITNCRVAGRINNE